MADSPETSSVALPAGTVLGALPAFTDDRGRLVELNRESAHGSELRPVQWNVMASGPNTLRGMHVHIRHTDWITVVEGTAVIGLVDLRNWTEGAVPGGVLVEMCCERSEVLVIPPGVLHGIFTSDSSLLLNGLSHEYDPSDDVAVRFDDPALGIEWPGSNPVLSDRDRAAPVLASMFAGLAARGEQLPGLPV